MLMCMYLTNFDICQAAVAPNSFEGHRNLVLFCLISGLKFIFSDVTSFLLDSLQRLKKDVFRSVMRKFYPIWLWVYISSFCNVKELCRSFTSFTISVKSKPQKSSNTKLFNFFQIGRFTSYLELFNASLQLTSFDNFIKIDETSIAKMWIYSYAS